MYIFRQQFSNITKLGVFEKNVENLSIEKLRAYIDFMLNAQNEQNYLSQDSEFAYTMHRRHPNLWISVRITY